MEFLERYGPWAIVAGASEGVGKAFARQLAARGLPSILVARREAPLIALRDEILAETGVACEIATVDLAAPDAVARVAEAVGQREIGLFISNAGADTNNGSKFLDNDIAAWEKLVSLNVSTMMRACHHFAAPMRARGKGGILLVNSGACYGGIRGLAVYTASKAFMLCFTEALWGELQPAGVDVLTLVLGQTDTPAYRKLLAEMNQPLPTDWASPDDVAALGLERLPFGPIQNWGAADDEAKFSASAASRRERVLMIPSM
jgi:short-subunit dehydrogenase